MAKLDLKGLDELIKEVVKITPDEYEGSVDITNILPTGSESGKTVWPRSSNQWGQYDDMTAKPRLDGIFKQLYGKIPKKAGFPDYEHFFPAKHANNFLKNLHFLTDAGLQADPIGTINKDDLKIYGMNKIEGSDFIRLPAGKADNAKKNVIKLEHLCMQANAGDAGAQKFLEDHIFHEQNVGILQGLYFVGVPNSWCSERLKAVYPARHQQTITPPDIQIADRGVISDPSMASQRAERGTRLQSEFSIFESFRADSGDLRASIEKLSEFSMEIANREPTPNNAPGTEVQELRKFINNMLVLDYFVAFTKEIDSGSGAYFFESFLAYLAGGVSAGKVSGIAGGMGETDFFKGDGSKGSAKFLRRGDVVSQSIKSFGIGQTVEYVVAYKRGELTQGTLTKMAADPNTDQIAYEKTSDPDKIRAFEIHVFNVTRLEPRRPGKSLFQVAGDGTDENKGAKLQEEGLEGELKLHGVTERKPTGVLYITALDNAAQSSYVENLDAYAVAVDGKIRQSYEAFRDLMKSLTQAKDKATIYAGQTQKGGKFAERTEAGKDALTAIKNSEAYQNTLIDLFNEKAQVARETGSIVAKEARLAELDKLILEVLKNNS